MLKLNEIKFPVVFNTISCGKITCHSKDRATDSSFNECHPSIVGNLIDLHNNHNPDNIQSLPYYVEGVGPGWKVGRSIYNAEKPEIKPSIQCAQIENMPLSATLKGVQISSESWVEITATPKTIEVHDDIITLLLHHGGFKNKTVSGEISIKRGTLVRYEVK
ncbi:hypothetical protein GCL20_11085 [Escherichia coli]|uniref:hypothetical protein n=1 Tax=Escherichia coli TaxID=562 RepID=UPI002E32F3D4|nr:hypothetical protein [Escherichia coli]MED7698743.1 hypothetical protein [Escherichia coli]